MAFNYLLMGGEPDSLEKLCNSKRGPGTSQSRYAAGGSATRCGSPSCARYVWEQTTGTRGAWPIPSFLDLSADYDGVHLTTRGYLETAGRAHRVGEWASRLRSRALPTPTVCSLYFSACRPDRS